MRQSGFECAARNKSSNATEVTRYPNLGIAQARRAENQKSRPPAPRYQNLQPKAYPSDSRERQYEFPSSLACRQHIKSTGNRSDWEEGFPVSAGKPNLKIVRSPLAEIFDGELEDLESLKSRITQEEQATSAVIKPCVLCKKPTFKDGGCNYMKCSDSDPPSSCPIAWCWQCYKVKYQPIPGQEHLGFCNDPSHNSH